jgi:hypothetical protein
MYLNRVSLIGFTGQEPKQHPHWQGDYQAVGGDQPSLSAERGVEGEDAA